MSEVASKEQAEAYYQEFSADVGLRDWTRVNRRHVAIQAQLRAVIDPSTVRRSLDVGCGAGVMSAHLSRFSRVTAVDFSRPAIELGRVLAPQVDFRVGSFAELPDERFDLVCAFDVLEHIPPAERSTFMSALAARLEPGGRLVLTTPHPDFTRYLHEHRPELLQVIDEPVEVGDVEQLAGEHGLRLAAYREYDVSHRPHYQMLVLRRSGDCAPRAPAPPSLTRAMKVRTHPLALLLRRARLAVNAARARRLRLALWLIRPRGPAPELR